MGTKVFDKLNANFHFFPKLNVTVTTCSNDKVSLGINAMSYRISVPLDKKKLLEIRKRESNKNFDQLYM